MTVTSRDWDLDCCSWLKARKETMAHRVEHSDCSYYLDENALNVRVIKLDYNTIIF